MIKWILNREKIKNWIIKQSEVLVEKPKFDLKLSIGLFLIIFSFIEYYGGAFIAVSLSVYFENARIAVIGVPAAYGLSWLLWISGMFLLGKQNYKYALYKFAKILDHLRK